MNAHNDTKNIQQHNTTKVVQDCNIYYISSITFTRQHNRIKQDDHKKINKK